MSKARQPQKFEDILARLQAIVEKLEDGKLTLEESLLHFEEGVRLSREGAAQLDKAERKVEMLLKDDGGGDRVVPAGKADDDEPSKGEVLF